MDRIGKLRLELHNILSEKRYCHSLGVAYTCACLAMRYDGDIEKAELAGLLHDCAKYLTNEEILAGCKEAGLPVTRMEEIAPQVLHGRLGAWFASERYGVTEEDVLSAIRHHTTGRPAMTLLEQIVFVADYVEPGRRLISGLDEVRRLAFVDLDKATCRILADTLRYLKDIGAKIDPATEETFRYYG